MINKELKRLMHQAKMAGCDLFMGDQICLFIYNSKGKICETYKYDYNETNYLACIKQRIDKAIQPRRRMWGTEFLELAPVAFSLGYNIHIGDYSALLITHDKSSDELSADEGTGKQTILLECPFSSEGLHTMSNYIANALMGEKLNEAEDEEEEENVIMEDVTKITLTKEFARVVAVMYYRMSPEEQQGLKNTADEEVNQVVNKALKMSAER